MRTAFAIEDEQTARDDQGNPWLIIHQGVYNERRYMVMRCPTTAALSVAWYDNLEHTLH